MFVVWDDSYGYHVIGGEPMTESEKEKIKIIREWLEDHQVRITPLKAPKKGERVFPFFEDYVIDLDENNHLKFCIWCDKNSDVAGAGIWLNKKIISADDLWPFLPTEFRMKMMFISEDDDG